jgi:DNA-binding GntR family transcriptional regulator
VVDYDQIGKGLGRPFEGRAQLGDEVASYIRDLIMAGQLGGGEYIRLDRLASHLGVSATPVREALTSLRAEGFLELEPRKGFFVLPLTAKDVEDVFYAQATIAGELAARAVVAIDSEAIESLRQIQRRLIQASERQDLTSVERENYQFHKEINLLAASPKLSWLLSMVMHYSPRRFYSRIDGWSKLSIDDHGDILLAFEEKDAPRAMEAMTTHIVHAGVLLVQFLGSLSDSTESSLIIDSTSEDLHSFETATDEVRLSST